VLRSSKYGKGFLKDSGRGNMETSVSLDSEDFALMEELASDAHGVFRIDFPTIASC
jgi:hypothetical protein